MYLNVRTISKQLTTTTMSLTKEYLYSEQRKKDAADFNDLDYFLSKLPGTHINNSRAIVRAKVAKMQESPSERAARQIEALGEGLEADWSDTDYGEGPKE